MRGTLVRLAVGLGLIFSLNCGSVSGDGSGSGGSSAEGGASGQAGAGSGGTGVGTGGAAGGGAGGAVSTGGHAGKGGAMGGAGAGGSAGGAGGHSSGGAGGAAGHASGGAAGGHAGTGATGAGGQAGAAGQSGGGQGGQSVDSGVTCADLASEYLAAVPAAEACTPGAANQCQTLMPLSLSVCTGCGHYVNDATTLQAIEAQWTAQNCPTAVAGGVAQIACPLAAIACINPGTPGDCVATDGAAPGGVCGYSMATPLAN